MGHRSVARKSLGPVIQEILLVNQNENHCEINYTLNSCVLCTNPLCNCAECSILNGRYFYLVQLYQPYNLRSSLWHWAWFGHLRPCMLDLNRGKSMIRKIWSFATFQIEINWNFFWTGLPKAYPQARLSGLGHCHLLEEMGVIPGMGSSRSFSGVLHLEKLKQTCFHLVICWTVAPAGI